MAGNKFDTSFSKLDVKDLTLTYNTYLGKTKVEGTKQQLINHLMDLT